MQFDEIFSYFAHLFTTYRETYIHMDLSGTGTVSRKIKGIMTYLKCCDRIRSEELYMAFVISVPPRLPWGEWEVGCKIVCRPVAL